MAFSDDWLWVILLCWTQAGYKDVTSVAKFGFRYALQKLATWLVKYQHISSVSGGIVRSHFTNRMFLCETEIHSNYLIGSCLFVYYTSKLLNNFKSLDSAQISEKHTIQCRNYGNIDLETNAAVKLNNSNNKAACKITVL